MKMNMSGGSSKKNLLKNQEEKKPELDPNFVPPSIVQDRVLQKKITKQARELLKARH